MPIDHTILGQVQPVQVGTPQQWEHDTLTLRQMTNQVEIQEAALEDRRRQLQAEAASRREDEEIERVFNATQGDFDAAWPELVRINRDKAYAIREQEGNARQQAADGLKSHLDSEGERLTLGAQILGGLDPDNPQSWALARKRLETIDQELVESMPQAWDQEWLDSVVAMGQDESSRVNIEMKALENIMSGKAHEGVASVLSMARTPEEYEEYLEGFRQLKVYDGVLGHFPAEFPGEDGLDQIAALGITPLDRAKLEADQAKQAQAADIEAGRAGREERRIGISERQADVAERRVAVSEEAAITKAAGAPGGDVRGTGEAANRFRVAAAAAVEEKGGEPLTAAENWQVYKDTVIGADDKTLTGRKPLTSNELSNIEQWRYEELSELEAPDATWMEPDELQTATVAYDKQRAFIEETYTRRLNGGPPPPKRYATSKKVWTMTIAQRQTVDEVLKQGGMRPTPDNVQTFLKNNPAFRQQLGLKEHKR